MSLRENEPAHAMLPENFVPVPLPKAYRLLNLGGVVIVSAQDSETADAMPAAWSCPLDVAPFKAAVVVDASHFTRGLIERGGLFALQLPTVGVLRETLALGEVSRNDVPDKLEKSGAKFFRADGFALPLVEGCAAWMIFRLVPEARMQRDYDLIVGECVAAWADPRVFRDGHWIFEDAPPALRTIHYVAGGKFYAIGEGFALPSTRT